LETAGNENEDGEWRIENGKTAMNGHPPSAPLQPRRILVRGVNWLGDAVITTPALSRLRERFPNAEIALLTPEKLCDLWRHHPAVNEIISFAPGKNVFSLGRRLRAGGFDLALVLPNSARSALEVWLAGIPERVGYARPWRNGFLTRRVAPRPDAGKMRKRPAGEIRRLVAADVSRRAGSDVRVFMNAITNAHQIHEYLHLAAALGANPEPLPPRLEVTAAEVSAAICRFGLAKLDVSRRLLFGLNAGAQYGPAKRWPVERFLAVAQEIRKRTNCVWIILGGATDRPVARQIESALAPRQKGWERGSDETDEVPVRNFAGQTSLRELCALLKVCHGLLTNDTGPMHVAAALGTPVVVPFGSTSPELTGPFLPEGARHRLLKANAPCSPCFRRRCPIDFRCMKDITVERVVEAMMEVAASF
jgi:lipopolysaccharide heptosyltransferase II